ncbi:TonB-dependent receptor [Sphingomonas sp.]|uniref:TonB-dependent receptor n=1 Tax=Sphingomonas sp. TaxID=28214 RepID=UPI002DD65515|nr:TonB-dependent receptor [Sphingomonas sp.]
MPAAAQTAPAQDDTPEVVVTGQRASDLAALLAKRDSDVTSEVVSANDVGKLPDQNVAEAVRRLSGVSVATDKGEGRYLIIRGIEPNLANVTINNQTASAPEPESRNVKLDDIPSGLIGSVTVIKTLTPDLDANAIAGQVDINTVSAFDKKGSLFGSARGVVGFFDDTDTRSREGDASVGGRFGANRSIGLVVAGNYSRRPSYSQNVLSGGRQLVNNIDLPVELDQRIYDPAIRTRKGAVANLDFRPSDDVKLYGRFLYSQFSDVEQRQRLRLFFPGDNNIADTTTLPPGYSALSATGGTISATTARRLLRSRSEITDTTTLSGGGDFRLGAVELKAEYTHAKSHKKDPIRDEVEYRAAASTGIGATFVNGDRLLTSLTANAAALNPANYRLNSYRQVSRNANETLDQFRIDVKIPFDGLGDGSSFKIGAKYLNRDRFQDQTGRTFSAVSATAGSRTIANDLGDTIATTFDGAYTFGPKISLASAQAFVFANNTNTTQFTVNANDQISQSTTSDYRVKEKVIAGYVMATIKSDSLTIIPGVRMERTEGRTSAIIYRAGVTTLNSTFDSFGRYEYTDWFPGVNLKYQVSPQLQARAAVTTAIGRPPFVNLAPTVTVDVGANTVSLGNPNLLPQKSLNLDAGLEYYFRGEGGLSVAVFYKRLTNPIFATSALNQSGTFGGVALTGATVNSFGNGDEGSLTGVEFAIQKPFTFLPSPLDGFGINANLTLSSSDLKVPGRTIKTPLVGQADTIASGQLYYEKYGISARVALSYRSAYLDTDGGLSSADATGLSDSYFGKITTIDARIGYRPAKFVEVFAEGNNLTDAQDYYYFATPNRFREGEKYGRSFRVGLTLTY